MGELQIYIRTAMRIIFLDVNGLISIWIKICVFRLFTKLSETNNLFQNAIKFCTFIESIIVPKESIKAHKWSKFIALHLLQSRR